MEGDYNWPLIVSGSLLAIISTRISHSWYKRYSLQEKLRQKHSELLEIRSSTLLKQMNNSRFSHLCDLTVSQICDEMNSGNITPIDVLRTFQCRTASLLPQNCIAEVILDADAQALKLIPSADNKSCLFGIPVSIKENLQIQSYESTLGLANLLGNHAEEDCVVVKVLKLAGAIPFVTTTMAPAGLSLDSSNAVYGEQRNPFDAKRLAGGSSGGEAVLIAGGGSPLGFGNDIAGSLRIPAAFCGISSLKPTFKRVSQVGLFSDYRRSIARVDVCVGPMAKKVDSLVCAMRCLLGPDMFSLDPTVTPIQFDEKSYMGLSKKSLVIGYYTELNGDLQLAAVPSIKRAVLETKLILEKCGHTLVKFQPPEPDIISKLLYTALLADGGSHLSAAFLHEPIPSHMRMLKLSVNLPSVIKRVSGWLISRLVCKIAGNLITCSSGCNSALSLLDLLAQIAEYEALFAKALTECNPPIDALICPVFPFPAPLADSPEIYLDAATAYTGLYNLLDYPAGVVPVTHVNSDDVFSAEKDEKLYSSNGNRANFCIAHMQRGSEGLPLTVQVVGKPMQEEVVLRIMREIETAAGYWVQS